MIDNLLNDIVTMRLCALMFFLLMLAFMLRSAMKSKGCSNWEDEYELLEAKFAAMKRKAKEALAQKNVYLDVLNETDVWGKQWKARAIWMDKRVQSLEKKLTEREATTVAQKSESVASAQGPPVTVINNFTGENPKEEKVKFPKNLDEVQDSFRKGGKLMSKMRKQKSLIREVGFFRAVMMFGLTYVLASMIKETWDRVKHRFEDEDKESGCEETDE